MLNEQAVGATHSRAFSDPNCTTTIPSNGRLALLGPAGWSNAAFFLSRHQTLMADSHLYLLQVRLQSDPVNPACAFKPGRHLSKLFLRCQWFYVPSGSGFSPFILSGFSCRYRETGRGRNGISIYEMERNLRTAASYLSHSLALFSSLRMPKSRFCRFGTTGGDETETDITSKQLVPHLLYNSNKTSDRRLVTHLTCSRTADYFHLNSKTISKSSCLEQMHAELVLSE